MKSVAVAAALGAGLALAQDRGEYFPDCSLGCFDTATSAVTDCALDDAWCWCIQANYEAIYNESLVCVLDECGAAVGINDVLPAAVEFCSAATSSYEATVSMTMLPSSTEEPTVEPTVEPTSTDEPEPTEPEATVVETTTSEMPSMTPPTETSTEEETVMMSSTSSVPFATAAAPIATPIAGAAALALGVMAVL